MILGSSGQNIYPEEIEDKLNNMEGVVESVVVQREGKLVALVFPDYAKSGELEFDSRIVALMKEKYCYVAHDIKSEDKLARETTVLTESYEVRSLVLFYFPIVHFSFFVLLMFSSWF